MKRKLKKFIDSKKFRNKNSTFDRSMEDRIKSIINGELSLSRKAGIGMPPNYDRKGGEWYG